MTHVSLQPQEQVGQWQGLVAGFGLLNSPIRVVGIDVGKLWRGFPQSIARLTGEIYSLLGEPNKVAPGEITLIENRYVGSHYGVPSPQGNAALCAAARAEGIFLDPVYTAKAMAGLIDLVQAHHFTSERSLIFLHTGGAPALFAFPDAAMKAEGQYKRQEN
jgi:1-aminocyclopropane-1-carboxylate deaminase/D-cysteine desulfhydrase-like pyridoxal-dependent ACC family enzyme